MVINAQLAPKKGAQKRSASRLPLRLLTSGRVVKGATGDVLIHDLSTGGMLIETSAKLALGDDLEVELPRTGAQNAQVVWSSGSYYGCRFAEPVAPGAVSAALLKSAPGPTLIGEATNAGAGGDLGSRIEQLRTERGWSLDELADRLGVSRQAVWYWETGQRMPRAALFGQLARALGVTEHELLEPARQELSRSASIEDCKNSLATMLGVPAGKIRILVEF
jgi:transcriptional regulator with XRE-family HTH domain